MKPELVNTCELCHMHNLYQLVTFIYFPVQIFPDQTVADLVADSTRRVAPSPFAFGDFLRRVVRGGWVTLGTPWEHGSV